MKPGDLIHWVAVIVLYTPLILFVACFFATFTHMTHLWRGNRTRFIFVVCGIVVAIIASGHHALVSAAHVLLYIRFDLIQASVVSLVVMIATVIFGIAIGKSYPPPPPRAFPR